MIHETSCYMGFSRKKKNTIKNFGKLTPVSLNMHQNIFGHL